MVTNLTVPSLLRAHGLQKSVLGSKPVGCMLALPVIQEGTMRRRFLILVAFVTLTEITFGSAGLAVAQGGNLSLTVENVMTPQELKDTGISGLTGSQRIALNTWLNRYTETVLKVAGEADSVREPLPPSRPPLLSTSSSCKAYPNTGEKESITENAHGKILILLDGSMWQVMEIDTIDSSLWLAVDDVIVTKAERPLGCYTYTIINTDEDAEKVQAQYLGQR